MATRSHSARGLLVLALTLLAAPAFARTYTEFGDTGGVRGGITVTADVSPNVVAQGGDVFITITIANNSGVPVTADLWVVAQRSGTAQDSVDFIGTRTLPAGASETRVIHHTVPLDLPPGPYVFTVNVGDFDTNTIIASDTYQGVVTAARLAAGTAVEPLVASELPGDLFATASSSETGVTGISPNPFSNETSVRFSLGEASDVRLAVYDVLGREVAVLVDGTLEAGQHTATFDARGLSSGTYVYRLVTGQTVQTGRMTLAN